MSEETQMETFEAFKKSFSYGSRGDLNFKFLAGLSDKDAAKFFQDLLRKLGDTFDDGDFGRIIEHVHQGQRQAYGGGGGGRWSYQEGPFAPLGKTLSQTRLALLTSTGHFVEGDDPQPLGVPGMSQEEATRRIGEFLKAEPTLSTIPVDTPPDKLKVRHGGYDVRGVQADRNVALPIDRLGELAQEGLIGELLPAAYSFVGACAQMRLLKGAGPQWVNLLL